MSGERVWTIVVAAGSGTRFGSAKQFELCGGERVVDRACDIARRCSDGIVVVLPSDGDVSSWCAEHADAAVVGAQTRSGSVRAGLAAVPPEAEIVCVHDAARPLASVELFDRVVDAVRRGADGAVPAVAVTDTIKVVDRDGAVVATPERSSLVAVQTPQAFRADVLRAAHAVGHDDTDDAAAVERQGARVVTVAGELWNRKITAPEDLEWVRAWLSSEVRR